MRRGLQGILPDLRPGLVALPFLPERVRDHVERLARPLPRGRGNGLGRRPGTGDEDTDLLGHGAEVDVAERRFVATTSTASTRGLGICGAKIGRAASVSPLACRMFDLPSPWMYMFILPMMDTQGSISAPRSCRSRILAFVVASGAPVTSGARASIIAMARMRNRAVPQAGSSTRSVGRMPASRQVAATASPA